MARKLLGVLLAALMTACAVSEGVEQKNAVTSGTGKRIEGVKDSLQRLKGAFEAGRTSEFMQLVSQAYVGETTRLETTLTRDFVRARNISLSFTYDNLTFDEKGAAFVAVTFSLGYTDADTGKQAAKKGETTLLMRFEDGKYKLAEMRSPPLFGIE